MHRPIAHVALPGVALALACAACADFARPPLFPQGAAEEPVVQEQALLGLSAEGDAAVVQLIAAEGAPPRLDLLRLDREEGATTLLERAPPGIAFAIARRLIDEGTRPQPLLEAYVAAAWPAALERAAALGFPRVRPADPIAFGPGRGRFAVAGAAPARLRLALRLDELDDPRAQAAFLGPMPGEPEPELGEVLAARMPLSGQAVPQTAWIVEPVAWILSGSVRGGAGREPLHRTVGLRSANLSRAEAALHDREGRTRLVAGELEAAGRELERALAADPRSVEALYHAAQLSARRDRAEDAIALLRRAVSVDLRRVQVLIRPDDDLRTLRGRPDVRALLGLSR